MRGVFEQDQFRKELEAIESGAHRADELIDGIKWTLCKEPRSGHRASAESSVWMIFNNEYSNVTPLVIYYTFDSENVFLLSICKTTPIKEL